MVGFAVLYPPYVFVMAIDLAVGWVECSETHHTPSPPVGMRLEAQLIAQIITC